MNQARQEERRGKLELSQDKPSQAESGGSMGMLGHHARITRRMKARVNMKLSVMVRMEMEFDVWVE